MTRRCQHCGERRKIRARGLCYVCYYSPKIRRLYKALTGPATPPNREPERLPEPTPVAPGAARAEVLRKRAGKLKLWSPEDAKPRDDPGKPWISGGVRLTRHGPMPWSAWIFHRFKRWKHRLGLYASAREGQAAIDRFLKIQAAPKVAA